VEASPRREVRTLPKESSARLILAVLAFVAASIAAGESVWYTVYNDAANATVRRCITGEAAPTESRARLECRRADERDRVLWTLAWGPVALGAAIVTAASGSRWRRRHLQPVPLDRLPALARLSGETAASTGSGLALPLLWRPARPVATARADGISERYIEVGPSFLGLALTAPLRAKAVLRHEYAHHRLRDVFPSRVLLAAGYVGLALTVPFVLTIWEVGFSVSLSALRLTVVVGIVAAARAGVLRAREFDADLWAAGDDSEDLRMALVPASAPVPKLKRLRAPFAHHPSPSARAAALREPWRRTQPSMVDAVLAGLTAAVAGPVISRLARDWFQFGDPALYADVIGWAITGGVLGGWLAMVVTRGLVGSRDREKPLRLAAFSWTLAAAVLVGGVVFSFPLYVPVRSVPGTLVGILGDIVLAMGLVIGTLWLRGVVEWWLEAPASEARPRWRRVPILAGAAVTGLLLGVLATLESSTQRLDANPELAQLLGRGAGEPLTFVTLIHVVASEWFSLALTGLAVVVPIGLWFVARSQPEGASVPFVRAVLIGLGGTVLGLVTLAIYRSGWNPIATAHQNGWYATVLSAYASQAIVGGVVASASSVVPLIAVRARLPLSVLAATVGALPAGVGTWVLLDAPAGELLTIVRDVVVIAVLGAFLGASVVETFSHRVRAGGRSVGVAAGVPVVAAMVLVAVGVSAAQARPSQATDDTYFLNWLQRPGVAAGLVQLQSACQGPIDPSAQSDLKAFRSQLAEPMGRPGTPELRQMSDSLFTIVDICVEATTQAVSAGRSTLGPEALGQIEQASQVFVAATERLQQRETDSQAGVG
jgi:hypothetical protein